MPGKTGCFPRSAAVPARTGFNEAPAKCRGKPMASYAYPTGPGTCASMRPQRNAGENATRRNADNARFSRGSFNEAPAKCRGKLDLSGDCVRKLTDRASMRPQRNAGEKRASWTSTGLLEEKDPSFNEAPAKCRGKLTEESARRPQAAHELQ